MKHKLKDAGKALNCIRLSESERIELINSLPQGAYIEAARLMGYKWQTIHGRLKFRKKGYYDRNTVVLLRTIVKNNS